jgi:hypothetical protein
LFPSYFSLTSNSYYFDSFSCGLKKHPKIHPKIKGQIWEKHENYEWNEIGVDKDEHKNWQNRSVSAVCSYHRGP